MPVWGASWSEYTQEQLAECGEAHQREGKGNCLLIARQTLARGRRAARKERTSWRLLGVDGDSSGGGAGAYREASGRCECQSEGNNGRANGGSAARTHYSGSRRETRERGPGRDWERTRLVLLLRLGHFACSRNTSPKVPCPARLDATALTEMRLWRLHKGWHIDPWHFITPFSSRRWLQGVHYRGTPSSHSQRSPSRIEVTSYVRWYHMLDPRRLFFDGLRSADSPRPFDGEVSNADSRHARKKRTVGANLSA